MSMKMSTIDEIIAWKMISRTYPNIFFLFQQCGVASYNLTLQKTLSPADLQQFGLSQTYLQSFQPAALAITYGHLLNARPEVCGQPAGSSPFICPAPGTIPGYNLMVSQTNLIGIQVLSNDDRQLFANQILQINGFLYRDNLTSTLYV
jgi:hypothetical protein